MKVYRSHIPFLRIFLAILLGLIFSYYVDIEFSHFSQIIIIITGLILAILTVKYERIFKNLWFIPYFIFGVMLIQVNSDSQHAYQITHKPVKFISTVQNIKSGKNGIQLYLNVHQISDHDKNIPVTYRQYAYAQISRQIDIGDTLFYKAFQKDISSQYAAPWEFDFASYLKTQSIQYTVFLKEDNIIEHRRFKGFSVAHWSYLQSQKIKKLFSEHLEDSESAVATSIFLGDKGAMSENQIESFKKAGLMHIMAVSGLHVGIIFSCLFIILKNVIRSRKFKKWNIILALIATWIFIIICGLPASACRAGLMITLIMVGKFKFPRVSNLNLLAVAAFLQVIAQPTIIFTIGFQFSYIAVLGIMFLYQPMLNILSHIYLHKYILQSIAISCAAQLAIAPLSMYYFGYFPTWFFLSSIPGIILTTVLLWLGIGMIVANLLSDFLLQGLAYLLSYVTYGLQLIGKWTVMMPLSGIDYFPRFWHMVAAMIAISVLIYHLVSPIKRLNGFNFGLIFTPFFVFSLSNYSANSDLYLIPSETNLSIMHIEKGRATVFLDSLSEKDKSSIERKMHVEMKYVPADFTCLEFNQLSMSFMSHEKHSDYIIIDKPYEATNFVNGSTYILNKSLSASDRQEWKKHMNSAQADFIDLSYHTKSIKL